MTEEKKSLGELMSEELALVTNEDGSVDLKVKKSEELAEPKKKKKPWFVGISENGEKVFAPIAGPNAAKVLHLKRDVAVCKHCRCTVHKRNAVVDPEGNVYCKPHWPYGPFTDPRDDDGKKRLEEAKKYLLEQPLENLGLPPAEKIEDEE